MPAMTMIQALNSALDVMMTRDPTVLVFGAVLDLAGGNRSVVAWGLGFASIGIFGALAPLARWVYLRNR